MKKGLLKKSVKRGPNSKKKKRGKYYNCGKKRHFTRECRLSKINHAKIDNPKKERDRKAQKEF
jgi:hypothetical protein